MSASPSMRQATGRKKQTSISRKEFLKVKQLFDELDTDKNGSLDSNEFAVFIRMMGIMVDHDNMDKNRDGRIDFKEMLQFVYPGASPSAIQSFCREHGSEGNSVKDPRQVSSAAGLLQSQLDEIKELFEFHSHGGSSISRERLME
eukprot:768244-Hanusia_phi.AAC.3